VAQLIEIQHVIVESIEIVDELLAGELDDFRSEYEIKVGQGVGAVEVPRGILYHDYKIDDKGAITKANCIIPTTQNNANIHHDLPELVTQQIELGKSDAEVTKLCEMLVRAYDPCISCSVHSLACCRRSIIIGSVLLSFPRKRESRVFDVLGCAPPKKHIDYSPKKPSPEFVIPTEVMRSIT